MIVIFYQLVTIPFKFPDLLLLFAQGASGLAAMKRNDGQTDVYLELNPGETVIVSKQFH